MGRRHFRSWMLLGALGTGVAACEGEPTGFSGSVSIERFFAGAYAVMPDGVSPSAAPGAPKLVPPIHRAAADPVLVNAVLRTGTWETGAGGANATLALESSVVTGLPAKLRVTGDAPFSRIVIAVPGASDFWELTLPAPVTEIQVIATGSSAIPNAEFSMEAVVGTANGLGAPAQQTVHAVDLANADVAVILRWNAYSDVDLHVTDPKEQEVFFANPTSPEGGRLDLDSNPACRIDGVNQEVITWPAGAAPVGSYKIVVDYWSDCGVARSDYTVTYMVRGQTVQTVNGNFEGPTSASARHEVATFVVP